MKKATYVWIAHILFDFSEFLLPPLLVQYCQENRDLEASKDRLLIPSVSLFSLSTSYILVKLFVSSTKKDPINATNESRGSIARTKFH